MVDTKITDLTELTVAASDDALAIVDITATETKKIQHRNLIRFIVDAVVATGSLTAAVRQAINLDNAGADIVLTILAAPDVGDELVIYAENNGAASHSVVLSGSVTWDGTNQTAVFNLAGDSIHLFGLSATRWNIISNNGVTFSA